MKKYFICTILCLFICSIAFAGVRKNWKVVKNTIFILTGKSVDIAQHIYGTPSQKVQHKKNQIIYIWGSEGDKLQGVQTKTVSNEKNSISQAFLDYGYNCFIALKTNKEGIIIEGIQIGFEPDRLSAGCRNIFIRSHQFCNAVQDETEMQQKVNFPNCDCSVYSLKDAIVFVIPLKY